MVLTVDGAVVLECGGLGGIDRRKVVVFVRKLKERISTLPPQYSYG